MANGSKSSGKAGRGAGRAHPESYAALSMRPLHVLVFLLPLVVLYEVGSFLYLADAQHRVMQTVQARWILAKFFDLFGAPSLHLPAIALVTVLVVWHMLLKDRWRVRATVLVGMWLEAFIWTLPVLVAALILLTDSGRNAAAVDTVTPLREASWQTRLTLSIGAGIYEELLFRLILITVVHLLVVDVLRLAQGTAYVTAAVASALLFALYHDVSLPGGGADLRLLGFYAVAGLYFAGLFIVRGFGIVVASHALYDVVILVVLPAHAASASA